MKISVKGGGMYGCVTADILQAAGYEVTLHEIADTVLSGASFTNFRRLHRGYHYPLSMQTAIASNDAHDAFIAEYGGFCYPMHTTYWIADDSKVLPGDYLDFVKELDEGEGQYDVVDGSGPVRMVSMGVGVTESMYDVYQMRRYFSKVLSITKEKPEDDVFVIDCTYKNSPLAKECEEKTATVLRINVQLPKRAQTVLYGPYCGVIPAIEGNFFFYHAALNNPREMLDDGAKFFPELANAAVLAVTNTTHVRPPSEQDHRPYWIKQTNEQEICVLGGKIAQSIDAAREVLIQLKGLGIMPDKRKAGERPKAF